MIYQFAITGAASATVKEFVCNDVVCSDEKS